MPIRDNDLLVYFGRYQEPRANSKVLTVITALTRVSVNMDESTDAFYKVSTSNGTQGYCMKKFIAVRR